MPPSRRELLEETGVEVVPGVLLWARDYIAANHQFADTEGQRHQIELVYACAPTDRDPTEPTAPDTFQIGTVWVRPGEVASLPLYPQAYKPMIQQHLRGRLERVRYLGDVN
jgi:ADP-ribose pyrophosphatase YjhB (NUDIX family)